ncbi:unnamed protein product [Lactuca virosa]|uniref:Uncharacterized protein n=1 Tax=Lactuca virosa TaxID=75947 RepID=A0AAU9LSF5_9ASTR|nr:unnamed protein product [Lactuca virosa]
MKGGKSSGGKLMATLRRLKSREAPYSEVSKGLYVGGWPSSPDKMPPGLRIQVPWNRLFDGLCERELRILLSLFIVLMAMEEAWR